MRAGTKIKKQFDMKLSNNTQAILLIIGLLFLFIAVLNCLEFTIDYLTTKTF